MLRTAHHSLAACLLAALVAVASPTSAAPQNLGKFGDWQAYADGAGAKKVCYAGTSPSKSEGKYTQRGPVFLLVSHRPGEKVLGEVSIEAGYAFKDNSTATLVVVGKSSFNLFTKGENAWAADGKADRAIVEAMKAGKQLTVKGTSVRGTTTTDSFSLSGFSSAFEAISKACGVN